MRRRVAVAPAPKGRAARSVERDAEALRGESRRFVDALASRLAELARLARQAESFQGFDISSYPEFRRAFDEFMRLAEEFQMLSHVTEEALAELRSLRGKAQGADEHSQELDALDSYFRQLQVPMLREVIETNFRLLRVWDHRLSQELGLPMGSKQIFVATLRVLLGAKRELGRPENARFLDDETRETASRAERMLRTLHEVAPDLVRFDDAQDDLAWGHLPRNVLPTR